jgi:transcriptional regulator with XRE-family HTH domain
MTGRTLAEKLDALFVAAGNPSLEEVARAIRRAGGPTISGSYLWLLRTGKKANPTLNHVEALAAYFRVPPAHFFADALSEGAEADLALLAALRPPAGRRLLRAAGALSPRSLEALAALADRLAALEGPGGGERPDGNPRRAVRRRAPPRRP